MSPKKPSRRPSTHLNRLTGRAKSAAAARKREQLLRGRLKTMEAALRESEERHRLITEYTADTIAILDLNLRPTFISPSVFKLRGLTVQEALTQSLDQILTPDSLRTAMTAFQEQMALESDGTADPSRGILLELQEYCKDGSIIWIELSASFLRNDKNEPTGILTLTRDIGSRKRAELQLIESERKFRSLAESSPDNIIRYDTEGRRTYVNPNFALTVSAEVASPPRETRPTTGDFADTGIYSLTLQQVIRTGQPDDLELLVPNPEGELRTHHVRFVAERSNDGTIIGALAIGHDITEQKRVQDLLRTREEEFRTLAANLPDQVTRFDTTGHIQYINPRVSEDYGITLEQVMGKTLQDLAPEESPSDDRKFFDAILRAAAEGVPNMVEGKWKTRRGERSFEVRHVPEMDQSGRVVSVLGIARDITDRTRTESTLRKLQLATEQSPASIIITDVQGRIEYMNPKCAQVSGYSPDEVRGENPRILRSGETTKEEYARMWETILGGSEWRGEFHNRRKDGTLYWESASISPIKDKEGRITHFVAVKEDITEQKRAEAKRYQLELQLTQAQKLESLGTLASGIAHDFNNILNIIIGHSTLLEHRPIDSPKAKRSIEAIQRTGLRGASLVQQLLTFAHRGESVFRSVSVNTIVQELTNLLLETFPKTIVITTDLQEDLPGVRADATQIHQVLLNLCVNARDAMPSGGTIRITSSVTSAAAVIPEFPQAGASAYILLSVSDTGTGIDEATKRRIFEPFFTTKGPGKGTGLGLALVYSILEAHGGMIAADSIPGGGTTFRAYLPVEEHSIASQEPSKTRIDDIPGGSETILVVEDEEMITEVIKASLCMKGYTVLTAADGEEGVEVFSRHRGEIALVLTDLGLPKYSGLEVFRRIRTIDPDAKVIIASGFIDPAAKKELLAAGLEQVIQKPYFPAEVLRTLRKVIDRR